MYDFPGDQSILDEICNRSTLFISTCLQHGCSLVRFLCGTLFYLHLVSQYLVDILIFCINMCSARYNLKVGDFVVMLR